MSYNEAIRNITLNADASLAGYTGVSGTPGSADPHYGKALYRFVKVTGARQCGRAAAADDVVVGVAQSKPQVVGQETTVAIRGISEVLAGEAFAPGDLLTTDNEGRAVKAGEDGAALAVAIEAATAANTVSSALLRIN